MLVEVDIRDFAIIRAARLELGRGLCVLSGETGAGKSILVDAVSALLGERASAELIRTGAEAARLQATFDLSDCPPARERLVELGFEPEADGLCVIAREIRPDGRGRCRINGASATVGMLRSLGEALIDLHGQHEHQSLLRVSEHRALLDAAGGAPLAAALETYRDAWRGWREALTEIASRRRDEGEQARRADMLRYQVGEIDGARLQPGELEQLTAERSRLAHAERLVSSAAEAYRALAEADDAPAAADGLAEAAGAVRDMARFDPDLSALAEQLEAALETVREAASTLRDYADTIDADPRRLDQVEERLDLLERLTRKYGGSLEAVLAYGAAAEAELAAIDTSEERLAALEAVLESRRAAAGEAAHALGELRASAAERLSAGVEAHLAELGLAGATFVVSFSRRPDPDGLPVGGEPCAAGPEGVDGVEFLFSAMVGEPPRPLARIASGGEISRVMLAVKSQLAAAHLVPTMVFDEVDAGIGGVTVHHVGRKLAALAAARQVLCITHHAPLAALADWHVAVSKLGADPGVAVERVQDDARVAELARMLGRMPPTEATLAMARELLAEAAAARGSS